MRSLLLSLLAFLVLQTTFAQDPYTLDKKLETSLLSFGGIGLGIDYLVYSQLKPIGADEFMALDADDVNAFDRWATTLNVPGASTRSDVGMYLPFVGVGTLILYIGINKSGNDFWRQTGKMGLLCIESNLLNFLLTDLTKNLVQRKRPYVYNPEFQDQSTEFGVSGRKSFFSGHTSFSATNAFFFAKVYSDYYPDSRWKPLVWTLAVAVPAWTGIERVLAGKHFPTDVMVGYSIGALCGYVIPQLHLKDRKKQMTMFPVIGTDFGGVGFVMQM